MIKKDEFIYGAQYFRPPNPPADQHEFHIKKIKNELGFNIVKFRLQWNAINMHKGKLELAEVHRIFDLCDRYGLSVMAEINMENAPYWLENKHPEARYVNANQRAEELGANDSTQSGGHPGLCFHNDGVKTAGEDYLRALIKEIKQRESLYAYDCWNEPHLEPAWICNYWGNMGDRLFCYCDATKQRFRLWLRNKYSDDINEFNKKWSRCYTTFDNINPPVRHGHYADWLDWGRFWFDELQSHMKWRYDIIKSEDEERFVMSHSGAVPPFLQRANAYIHNWKLAEPVDKWGTSFAPKAFNWSLSECAGTMDATRSAARGKEFWISEMTGGSVYVKGFGKTPATRARDVRAWNWLAVAYGAKAIVYWCYLNESTGPEAGSFGLIKYNGENTKRALEAAKQKKLIGKYSSIINEYKPRADIAILYDPDNSSQLFAMKGDDELYGQSHIGYYRTVWENDLFAKFVTYDNIEDIKEKVLIVPMCLTLPENAAKKIRRFVQQGGVLICEARTGLFDDMGFLQPDLPSFGLHEAAGLKEDEALYSDIENKPLQNNDEGLPWNGDIYNGPEIMMDSKIKGKLRVNQYLAPLLLKEAQKLGGYKDVCLAARNDYGKGEVYYFGTYLGMALFKDDKGAKEVLSKILKKYTEPKVKGGKLRPRLIEGKGKMLLAVFNDNKHDSVSERIRIPARYKSAFDIMDGKKVKFTAGKIKVSLDPEDAAVFCLE